ncbi:MAG: hypothetical protein ACOCQG_05090 [Candidatus Nanoarchaeia archaeon]
MSDIVSIPKDEYNELQLYKRLVVNNLIDNFDDEEIKKIEADRKTKLLKEEDAKKKYPEFFEK